MLLDKGDKKRIITLISVCFGGLIYSICTVGNYVLSILKSARTYSHNLERPGFPDWSGKHGGQFYRSRAGIKTHKSFKILGAQRFRAVGLRRRLLPLSLTLLGGSRKLIISFISRSLLIKAASSRVWTASSSLTTLLEFCDGRRAEDEVRRSQQN